MFGIFIVLGLIFAVSLSAFRPPQVVQAFPAHYRYVVVAAVAFFGLIVMAIFWTGGWLALGLTALTVFAGYNPGWVGQQLGNFFNWLGRSIGDVFRRHPWWSILTALVILLLVSPNHGLRLLMSLENIAVGLLFMALPFLILYFMVRSFFKRPDKKGGKKT